MNTMHHAAEHSSPLTLLETQLNAAALMPFPRWLRVFSETVYTHAETHRSWYENTLGSSGSPEWEQFSQLLKKAVRNQYASDYMTLDTSYAASYPGLLIQHIVSATVDSLAYWLSRRQSSPLTSRIAVHQELLASIFTLYSTAKE